MVNLIPVDFCLDICFKIGLMGSKFHGPHTPWRNIMDTQVELITTALTFF